MKKQPKKKKKAPQITPGKERIKNKIKEKEKATKNKNKESTTTHARNEIKKQK